MTPDHFQQQVVSTLKGIEKVLKELSVNLGLRQEPETPPKYTKAHICIRPGKTKLMSYPTTFCSMCHPGQSQQSIDLIIEEGHFKHLEDLLKKLP